MTHPLPSHVPIEPLEPRRQFAAAVALVDHVLTVTGANGVDNVISVGLSADGGAITASVTFPAQVPFGKGTYKLPTAVSQTFPLSDDVTGVRITGGDGADTITVDQTNGSFTVPTTIQGGAGNDTITGGDEADRISGGPGDDSINGGAGNDSLFGQQGDDVLIGGPGNDYLAGMRGYDSLVGGDGNDTLQDPFGPDTVLGGAGHNVFNLHSLHRDVHNDFNPNTDKLHLIAVPGPGDTDNTGFFGSLFPISSLL